jgi:hypothetical protein
MQLKLEIELDERSGAELRGTGSKTLSKRELVLQQAPALLTLAPTIAPAH